jgi:hypothetical protein
MSIKNININLNRRNAVYYSGETIAGKLTFQVTQRVRIQSLKMYVNGYATCEFANDGKIGNTVKSEQCYLACSLNFVTKEVYGDEIYLEIGDYSYSFEIVLPANLPSSLWTRFGQIIYNLIATFEIPWSFDKRHTQNFTVINLMDLSKLYNAQTANLSYFVLKSKVYGFGSCATQPLSTKLKTNKNKYAIDEVIEFEVFIDNKSARFLKKLKVYLVKSIVISIGTKKKEIRKTLDSAELNQIIEPQSEYMWKGGKLKVPFTQPTTTSKHVKIEYSVHVEVVAAAFFSLNFSHGMVVTIGCIPCTAHAEQAKPTFEIETLKENPFK